MIITGIIFIVILGILVFVHEFGHFIVAKKSGMQVEEFGFGFPPRIVGLQRIAGKWKIIGSRNKEIDPSKTVYSINAIPLGGFVRILGENNEAQEHPGSFINKGFWPRFFTLVAGVAMNVVLAWVLLSVGYAVGLPVAVDSAENIPAHSAISQPKITILDVTSGLPADKAGLKINDVILSVDKQPFSIIPDMQNYIKRHAGISVNFEVQRGAQDLNFAITPNANPKPNEGATGIGLSIVGNLKYPLQYALWEGAVTTWNSVGQIFSGLVQLVTGKVGIAGVGGPVKIAQLVGQARQTGFMALMTLTIMLSLSLAVLNILPFPALDGGRVLFLIIEAVRRKKNNAKVEQIVNTAGFVLLILLMIAVTIKDIITK